MRLPDDVFASVVAERALFGEVPTSTELGLILNRAAWPHRNHPAGTFGVSHKVGGKVAIFPGGGTIGEDVLMLPDGTYWDVLIKAGAEATPHQGESKIITDPDRYWVAPVDPGPFKEPTEPTDPPMPSPEIDPLIARIEGLEVLNHDLTQAVGELATRIQTLETAPSSDPSQWEAAGKIGWWGVTLPLRRKG
jgi:hypothetical protein